MVRLFPSRSVAARVLAPAAALSLILGACSSKSTDGGSAPQTTGVEPATAAAAGSAAAAATGAATGGSTPAANGGSGGSVGTNPAVPGGSLAPLPGETIEHYYQRIGMPDNLAQCYTTALTRLGISDLHQLESNQALSAKATAQFEACVKANPVTNH